MIESFSEKKSNLINLLSTLQNHMKEINEKFGIDLYDIREKIDRAIDNLSKEKFTIALFGAFSDGKSTIISALNKRLDIKISPDPTTDKISEYSYGDLLIIDTPGLFSEHLLHDEITKKYISEANVVIYTVSSINPLKASHHDTVKWLLDDLGKIDSTIFVINKMDEVADIEDNEDFIHHCNIKKNVVKNTLKDILGKECNPKIVCIAADPLGKGLEYWLSKENEELYRNCSHIEDLRQLIDSFVNEAKEELIGKAGISVIKDAINITLDNLSEVKSNIGNEISVSRNEFEELRKTLGNCEKDIQRIYLNIKDEILNYREHILNDINIAANQEDLKNIIERNIGNEAYILKEKIEIIINKHLHDIENIGQSLVNNMTNSIEYYDKVQNEITQNETTQELLNSGISFAKNFGMKIVNMEKRDLMNKLLQIKKKTPILNKLIKFKRSGPMNAQSWASRWADNIKIGSKFVIGGAIVFDFAIVAKGIYDKVTFNKEKQKIKDGIEAIFKEVINNILSFDSFKSSYFSYLKDIENEINLLSSDLDNLKETAKNIDYCIRDLFNILNNTNAISMLINNRSFKENMS